MIFHSEYPEDEETGLPSKFSYHLVCPGVYFENWEAMKEFGEYLKNTCSVGLANDIDPIWGPTRQLRIVGSWKLDKPMTSAKKLLMHITSPEDQEKYAIYKDGFVTDFRNEELLTKLTFEHLLNRTLVFPDL